MMNELALFEMKRQIVTATDTEIAPSSSLEDFQSTHWHGATCPQGVAGEEQLGRIEQHHFAPSQSRLLSSKEVTPDKIISAISS